MFIFSHQCCVHVNRHFLLDGNLCFYFLINAVYMYFEEEKRMKGKKEETKEKNKKYFFFFSTFIKNNKEKKGLDGKETT